MVFCLHQPGMLPCHTTPGTRYTCGTQTTVYYRSLSTPYTAEGIDRQRERGMEELMIVLVSERDYDAQL